jgi:hypothetical protein
VILLFWIPGALAAAAALLMPFRHGLAALLLLMPLSNSYASAGAAAILLMRWSLVQLPRAQLSRIRAFVALATVGLLGAAIVQSLLVSSDLARLGSESVQWLLGVGLFLAVLIERLRPSDPLISGAFCTGAALLALTQLVLRSLEIEVPEEAATSLLRTDANNYTALFVLFGLVIVPLTCMPQLRGIFLALLVAAGFASIWFNESRGMLAVGIGVVSLWVAMRIMRPLQALALGGIALGIGAVAAFVFLREAFFDPSSLLSVGNFETNFSNLERLGLILHSVEFFLSNPLGAGIGASSDIFPNSPFTVGSYPTPHNTLAMLMVELGWLGVILYAAIIGLLATCAARNVYQGRPDVIQHAALFAATVFDAVLFNGSVALVFWLLLAFSTDGLETQRLQRTLLLRVER